MANMTIPNMPDELHRQLQSEAARTGRSLDEQAIILLTKALRHVPPVRLPTPIKPLRPITAEEVVSAIREGRE